MIEIIAAHQEFNAKLVDDESIIRNGKLKVQKYSRVFPKSQLRLKGIEIIQPTQAGGAKT